MSSQPNKFCHGCETLKSIDQFNRNKNTKDAHTFECRKCANQRAKTFRASTPERNGRWRHRWYMQSYGLTVDEVLAKIESQGGRCAICGTNKPGGRGQFSVDHNHDTGKIRGMLCQSCNTGLGSFGDSPARLQLAKDYLENYP